MLPSSLDSFLSLVLQPLPPDDAERCAPDRWTVRPGLERTDSPALLPSGFRFSPEQPGFGTFPLCPSDIPPRAGATRRLSGRGRPPSGLLSLAEPAYAPHPSTTATTVFVTGFRQRFVPSSQTSFRTCGGHRRWIRCWRFRVVSPRPVYLYSVVFFCLASEGCACPGRGDVSFFGALIRMHSDRRLLFILLHMLRESSLNRGLRRFRDWWDFVGCVTPLRLASLRVPLLLTQKGEGGLLCPRIGVRGRPAACLPLAPS